MRSTIESLIAELPDEIFGPGDRIRDHNLDPAIPWRPHLYSSASNTAWHFLSFLPESDAWTDRIARSLEIRPDLTVVVCAETTTILNDEFLEQVDAVGAEVVVADPDLPWSRHPSLADLIWQRELQLEHATACQIIERNLARALEETDLYIKGKRFEAVVALVLSQVDGFKVVRTNMSAVAQEMDVVVQNRNTSDLLGGSPIVIAECKNWTAPIDPPHYTHFRDKLQSRRGRAKLGFFITASRFTAGVRQAALRDSKDDVLIVLLDGVAFPAVWRDAPSITEGITDAVLKAAFDK